MPVHAVRMSLLWRAGGAPAALEQGLRDGFVVEAMQTPGVAARTPLAARSVPRMFHRRVAEQEFAGTMGQFITT